MAERKKYIEVEVPILNSSMRVLGTVENLHDKTIKLDLTRQLRGKGLTIKLRIFNQEGKLMAFPNSMELSTSYIRRIMRKRTDYVEDSFQARCLDIKVTVKPLLITRKKVSRAVRKNLRNTAREFILGYLKERNYIQVCNEILDGTLQKTMLPKLKKVYPLSFSDIRIFETKELANIDMKEAAISVEEEEIIQEEEIVETQEEETKKETVEKIEDKE
jgi:ribosomal protein S3AE